MGTNWRAALTLCPFYHEERERSIVCEGIPKNTTCSLCFPTAAEKREHKTQFCENDYKNCPYAKILYQKWDR